MQNQIKPGFSVYLDFVRLGAATVVLLSHVWPLLFPSFPLPWPGHEAVVVFFVLSGYVIAFATDRPGLTLSQYAVHRAVRILSVTVPAILLSVAIAPLVAGAPDIRYAGSMSLQAEEIWHAVWVNLLFLGESWSYNVQPPFNPPYWSLSFEVWFYIIFGLAVFMRGPWRIPAVLLAMTIAGPRILALFPVWLMGVWLFRANKGLGQRSALVLFLLSAGAAFVFFWTDSSTAIRTALARPFPELMGWLHGANQFVGDFLLGLIVTAHFAAARSLEGRFYVLLKRETQIKYLASFTLSIYLFHMPLTVLIWNGLQVHVAWAFLPLLAAGIFILGSLTERRNGIYRSNVMSGLAWFRSISAKKKVSTAVAPIGLSAGFSDPDEDEGERLA